MCIHYETLVRTSAYARVVKFAKKKSALRASSHLAGVNTTAICRQTVLLLSGVTCWEVKGRLIQTRLELYFSFWVLGEMQITVYMCIVGWELKCIYLH